MRRMLNRCIQSALSADWEKILRMTRIAAGAALLGVITWQVVSLPRLVGRAATARIDPALANLNGTLSNVNAATLTGKNLVEMVSKDYYDPKNPESGWYWEIYAMIQASTVTSRSSAELVEDLRAALLGGKDTKGVQHEGVLPVLTATIGEVKTTIVDARADLNKLTTSADASLKPLAETMKHIEALSEEMEKELKEGSPKAIQTLSSLNQAVQDFDKILTDPSIQKTLASSAKAADHLAESSETIDIALRPWRKKVNQLKWLLEKAAGMLKIVWTL